jgi:hypothetical protein
MKATAIRIHAPTKVDVGALVLGERTLGVLFVHAEVSERRFAFPFDVGSFEAIWGVAAIAGH